VLALSDWTCQQAAAAAAASWQTGGGAAPDRLATGDRPIADQRRLSARPYVRRRLSPSRTWSRRADCTTVASERRAVYIHWQSSGRRYDQRAASVNSQRVLAYQLLTYYVISATTTPCVYLKQTFFVAVLSRQSHTDYCAEIHGKIQQIIVTDPTLTAAGLSNGKTQAVCFPADDTDTWKRYLELTVRFSEWLSVKRRWLIDI